MVVQMITVRESTSAQTKSYNEQKYNEFLQYYFNTDIPVQKIYQIIGLNQKNSTCRYIKKRLRKDGYNQYKRIAMIHRGEWIK